MGDVIAWGLWGTGQAAHHIADDFRLTPNAALRAVASRTAERAREFAQSHRIERHGAGLDSLLNDAAIDAIYIASPSARHVEDSLAVIGAGKAVVCEKPFALDAAGARRVAAAARERGVFCMEAMWTRFIPAVIDAKARIDRGELGAIRLLQGNFAYAIAPTSAPALFDRAAGGGALLDRGVYLISLAHYLLGAPDRVEAVAVTGPDGVDEQSAYQLTFPGGAMADLTASLCVHGSNNFSVFGDRGRLCLHDPFYRASRMSIQPSAEPPPDASKGTASAGWKNTLRSSAAVRRVRGALDPLLQRLAGRRQHVVNFAGHGYHFELTEASRCIAAGLTESPLMTLADSIDVMQTMDRLRASFTANGPRR